MSVAASGLGEETARASTYGLDLNVLTQRPESEEGGETELQSLAEHLDMSVAELSEKTACDGISRLSVPKQSPGLKGGRRD